MAVMAAICPMAIVIGAMMRFVRRLRCQIEPAHHVAGPGRRIEQPGVEDLRRIDHSIADLVARGDRIDRRELRVEPRQSVIGGKIDLGHQQPVGDRNLPDRLAMRGKVCTPLTASTVATTPSIR